MLKLAQTDQQTDQQTNRQTDRQGKNNMSPSIYWWTAKSLDNAPYTSLKETKLKPSYHENSPQKTNSRKFAAKQKQGKITTNFC